MSTVTADATATYAGPEPKIEPKRARLATGSLATLHLGLAAFVACHAYPATQDGPAHLYAVHVLHSLAADPNTIFKGFFASNLHPTPNSLFTYLALALPQRAPLEWAVSAALLLSLLGMPLSLIAFTRALRSQIPAKVAYRLPSGPGPALACVLAFNYFLYRGLFNYVLSVPCAFAALAALLALGRPHLQRSEAAFFTGLALLFSGLVSLAHPAAAVFLLAASAFACVAPGRLRRVVGLGMAFVLLTFMWSSRIHVDSPQGAEFMGPSAALQAFVRAFGVTQTWLELLPAGLLLGFGVRAALSALTPLARLRAEWSARWPALLAVGMALGFFVLPFSYGGVAGLNERIPIFSLLLLLPYVELPRRLEWLAPTAYGVFALYTVTERLHLDRLAAAVRDSPAALTIPAGSTVYAVSLQVKMGTVSADLGRHLLADVARQQGLITGNVFCSHPAHVLRCTEQTPPVADMSAVQAFEHLSAQKKADALADPSSPIRRLFEQMRSEGAGSPYLLVIGAEDLNAAFEQLVARPLGARLLSSTLEPLRAYRIERRAL